MDPTMIFITTMVQLVTKFGIPMTKEILSTWDSNEIPTDEDIAKLKDLVKKPSSYFEDERHQSPMMATANMSPKVRVLSKIIELINDDTIEKVSITFEVTK